MTRSTKLMIAVLLTFSPAIHAQDNFLISLRHGTDQDQWQQVGANMSPGKYAEAIRQNRRLARERLTDTIVSLGVPEMGLNLVGAAVALAVDDLKVPLNKSRTLALEIDDATTENRSALLKVKFDW